MVLNELLISQHIMEDTSNAILEEVTSSEYKYGFYTDMEMDQAPRGLNEDIVRFISAKKNEPDFMLEYRLKAFRHWQTLKEPTWAHVDYPPIDFKTSYTIQLHVKTQNTTASMKLTRNCLKPLTSLGSP